MKLNPPTLPKSFDIFKHDPSLHPYLQYSALQIPLTPSTPPVSGIHRAPDIQTGTELPPSPAFEDPTLLQIPLLAKTPLLGSSTGIPTAAPSSVSSAPKFSTQGTAPAAFVASTDPGIQGWEVHHFGWRCRGVWCVLQSLLFAIASCAVLFMFVLAFSQILVRVCDYWRRKRRGGSGDAARGALQRLDSAQMDGAADEGLGGFGGAGDVELTEMDPVHVGRVDMML